tara:strand:- start:125 stop:616 length:492 start_codon:yes stop_codon:yes gene_type:complete
MAIFFTIVGWGIIYLISDRSSRRSETRADFQKISDTLDEIKKLSIEYKLKHQDERDFSLFEVESSSKISRVEMLSNQLTDRLDLSEILLDTSSLSTLRELMTLQEDKDLDSIIEICEDFEDKMQSIYHQKYYLSIKNKYSVELFVIFLIIILLSYFYILLKLT